MPTIWDALSGLGLHLPQKPRALPWAALVRAVGPPVPRNFHHSALLPFSAYRKESGVFWKVYGMP